jgi:heptosyltransferase-2
MPERILIVGLNWIGDAIMSMPAIQACRAENPNAHIGILVKPYLKPLWEMHEVPNQILSLEKMGSTISEVRDYGFDTAYILPNSFRSALIPALAGIGCRIGLSGDHRRLMLTQVISAAQGHQSNEYFPILASDWADRPHELPALNIPESVFGTVADKLSGIENYAVLMPGAARGASKMWPLKHFEHLAKQLQSAFGLFIVFAGGAGDAEACEKLVETLGDTAISVAGNTNLKEWAALLSRSKVSVANDSGGMHLAGAVGAPVVGIYGITDPEKTGPLAERFRVVQNSTVKSRDISRDSEKATKALESIHPDQVLAAVAELLEA